MARVLVLLAGVTGATASPCAAMSITAADGAVLEVEDRGRGEPVVLLAGGPGFTPAYLSGLCDWIAVARRCLLLHQRGTGQSVAAATKPGAITLATFVGDLEALRRALRQDRLTLLGHSWGGMLAMAYAAAHPSRVRALVLLASGGPTLDYMAAYDRNAQANTTDEDRRALADWQAEAQREGQTPRVVLGAMTIELGSVFVDRTKVPALVAMLGPSPLNRDVFDRMLGDLRRTRYDLRPPLEALTAPVLLLQGREDPIATIDVLRQTLSRAAVVLIDRAGHYPWFERPDEVFRSIGDFLRRIASQR